MKKENSKSTILVISMGFLILYLVFSWQWAVFISLIVGIAGLISWRLSRLIEKGWMGLARVLSYIIPSILLGIVFYLFLFPISIVSRIFTKDPLLLSGNYRTYFLNTENKAGKKSFERIW
jgi:hypothetical protein